MPPSRLAAAWMAFRDPLLIEEAITFRKTFRSLYKFDQCAVFSADIDDETMNVCPRIEMVPHSRGEMMDILLAGWGRKHVG